jgi:hypothetical protein
MLQVARTPSPPLEPHHAGSVSSRTAASELPFYDSNHPQVCCELLNLFPHIPLAAGEPPRQILIAAARLLLFKSIRDPNASLCFFLGSYLQNTRPSATHTSATRSSIHVNRLHLYRLLLLKKNHSRCTPQSAR